MKNVLWKCLEMISSKIDGPSCCFCKTSVASLAWNPNRYYFSAQMMGTGIRIILDCHDNCFVLEVPKYIIQSFQNPFYANTSTCVVCRAHYSRATSVIIGKDNIDADNPTELSCCYECFLAMAGEGFFRT